MSSYIRTFTEEEDAKRSGTVFEHALRLERQRKSELQSQISNLTNMLEETSSSHRTKAKDDNKNTQAKDDLLSSRRLVDETILNLQKEMESQVQQVETLKSQRHADIEMIQELLNEQENLRQKQVKNVKATHQMEKLTKDMEKNEQEIAKYQKEMETRKQEIEAYEHAVENKKRLLVEKEKEIERMMKDCQRLMQEEQDRAQASIMHLEDALGHAKESLEQQVDMNTYLREEVTRLREENHHLKNQLEDSDRQKAEDIVRLEREQYRQ